MNMKVAKVFTWIGLFAMTFGLVNGFLNGDFFFAFDDFDFDGQRHG